MAKRVTERWSDEDTSMLISVWEERMDDYRLEKKAFYVAAAEKIAGKDWKSVKNRCEFLDRRYETIKTKMSASGFGTRSSDPPTLRATILKELKWYYELDELLGAALGARPNAEDSCNPANPPTVGRDSQGDVVSGVETRVAEDSTSSDPDPRSTSTSNSGAGGSSKSGAASGAGVQNGVASGASGGNGAVGASGANTKKRKAPEPSITEVLRELGVQGLAVERERLTLMRQQLEFDMLTRREELELRREMAEQRRQEFEMKLQTMKAQYELDKSRWEAKLRKSP